MAYKDDLLFPIFSRTLWMSNMRICMEILQNKRTAMPPRTINIQIFYGGLIVSAMELTAMCSALGLNGIAL